MSEQWGSPEPSDTPRHVIEEAIPGISESERAKLIADSDVLLARADNSDPSSNVLDAEIDRENRAREHLRQLPDPTTLVEELPDSEAIADELAEARKNALILQILSDHFPMAGAYFGDRGLPVTEIDLDSENGKRVMEKLITEFKLHSERNTLLSTNKAAAGSIDSLTSDPRSYVKRKLNPNTSYDTVRLSGSSKFGSESNNNSSWLVQLFVTGRYDHGTNKHTARVEALKYDDHSSR